MLWWIVQTACVSTLLAAVVAVVGRVGRVSPAVKHALWLLVLAKLMTPPLACYRLPLAADSKLSGWFSGAQPVGADRPQRDFPDPSLTQDAIDYVVQCDVTEVAVDPNCYTDTASTDVMPLVDRTRLFDRPDRHAIAGETELSAVAEPQPIVARLQSGGLWLLAAWLLGAIPFATIQWIRLNRLRRFMKYSTPAPLWLEQLVRRVAVTLNIRPPQIVVSQALCSPLVCALGRPRLVWPAALSNQLPHEAREAVIFHELAHLRRRDHWVAWLELAAGVLWWFNPVYWYVRHQLRENAELACDAWVVGCLPSSRRAYALALIEVIEFVSSAPAAFPAVAMGNVARSSLERRLTMILRQRTSYRVPLLGTALIGLMLLAILPGWSAGQAPGPSVSGTKTSDTLPQAKTPEPRDPIAAGADDSGAKPPAPANVLSGKATNAPLAISDRPTPDDRVAQLEAKLTQLLAEVQAVRRAGAPPAMRGPAGPRPGSMGYRRDSDTTAFQPQPHYLMRQGVQGEGNVETLTRAKYKLAEAAANSLASFIKDFVKNDVEARVDGDTLTVIATDEDQARIRAFIGLLRDRTDPHGPNRASRADQPSKTSLDQEKGIGHFGRY